ncbi:hypothetical protein [Legionella bononiensis]|uniref:Uncharacterized protein n=1 Tax=Legionella bononiensis TaxID=2793102 RepID=A0ABS1W8W1_9GAMM|nr:hypothetical protein [Legionella bononiensis]MBL7525774.1 hypothetical protein [Legionella bononiensis]MBL7561956.1 hypothetical protein [Legionella bononiensis]
MASARCIKSGLSITEDTLDCASVACIVGEFILLGIALATMGLDVAIKANTAVIGLRKLLFCLESDINPLIQHVLYKDRPFSNAFQVINNYPKERDGRIWLKYCQAKKKVMKVEFRS